jgi:hypothetical protein
MRIFFYGLIDTIANLLIANLVGQVELYFHNLFFAISIRDEWKTLKISSSLSILYKHISNIDKKVYKF